MINVIIDEFTPCLKDVNTGELVQTEVIRIKRKSFLKKYNKKNGWYTNWEKLADENEIYALVIEGTVDIQGLIALTPNKDMKAVYISWMCTAPQNNKIISEDVRYLGVGGHLFAIAANEKLMKHYVDKLNAEEIGILHPYQFAIDEENAKQIMEVYDYVWTDEEI